MSPRASPPSPTTKPTPVREWRSHASGAGNGGGGRLAVAGVLATAATWHDLPTAKRCMWTKFYRPRGAFLAPPGGWPHPTS
jgi:hypothetical protein